MIKIKVIVAIIVIGAVLITAILNDIDGILVAAGLTAIAGLGGFAAGKAKRS